MMDKAQKDHQTGTTIDPKSTQATRARYNRIAPLYDFMETLPEIAYASWRERFWRRVGEKLAPGDRLLELGVGTGKNLPYWPEEAQISAIDLAPKMLNRARERADHLGISAEFKLGDAQRLDFPDHHFDLAAATFVFCSVPDPSLGLKEILRVVRPGGWVFLMEHVRAQNALLGRLMDLVNPLVVRTMGPNINRDTVGNVRSAGLALVQVEDLGLRGIFKMISARVGEEE